MRWTVPGEVDFCLLPWPQVGTGIKSPVGVEGRILEPDTSAEPTVASPDCIEVLKAPGFAVQGCRGFAHAVCICHAEMVPCAIMAIMTYPGIKRQFSCRGWRWEDVTWLPGDTVPEWRTPIHAWSSPGSGHEQWPCARVPSDCKLEAASEPSWLGWARI